MTEHFIVTADPPTPNGDLHVGHLSGPYFAADVTTRHLRQRGASVAFFSNFDPNQSYVVTAGRRLGMAPHEVVDHFSRRIAETLAADAIEPDLFGTADERQNRSVYRFFADLHERGKLLVRDEPIPYCGHCGQHLFEAYVQGTCPHCGQGCYGNGCEACSRPNLTKDMGEPICRLCGRPPTETRVYRGLFLPLARYQDELRIYLESRRGFWRPHVLDLVLPLLERPLPDIPLSFVSDYGLPVELPGFAGQVYNVRLEILPALIDTFDRWREAQADGGWDWREVDDYRVLHFHGYENGFQYVVSFNSLILASGSSGLAWHLPHASVTNEFYLLDGKKFSTTRNHAVWGSELLAEASSDQVRFYLALTNPEVEETNFVLDELRRTTDRLLTEPWNAVQRAVAGAMADERARRAGSASPGEEAMSRVAAAELAFAAAYAVESLSLRRAGSLLAGWVEWLAEGAARLAAETARPGGDDGFRRELSATLAGLAAFAVFAEPVMPRFATRLRDALGVGRDGGKGWEAHRAPVDPGRVRWGEDLCMAPLVRS